MSMMYEEHTLAQSNKERSAMLLPQYWLRQQRLRRALVDYPYYDVPFKKPQGALSRPEAEENFSYFMRMRHERLKFLQGWLHRNFDVDVSLDANGLLNICEWIRMYGGCLSASDCLASIRSFSDYDPAWRGEFSGNNVVVDIATYFGEYLIFKRPRLRWELLWDLTDDDGRILRTHPGTPAITGFPQPVFRLWKYDSFYNTKGLIDEMRKRSVIGSRETGGPLINTIKKLKTDLHVAPLPDGNYDFTFGDYSDEPL